MSKRYQVVGALALVTQTTLNGPMKVQLYRGAILGPGATDLEIKHNLSIGLIKEVGDGAAGLTAEGEPVLDPPTGDEPKADGQEVSAPAKDDTEPKTADDQAADSTDEPAKPLRNAAKPTLVAWVVANRGVPQADADKMTAKDLWQRINEEPAEPTAADDAEQELAELREQAKAAGYGPEQVDEASAEDLRALLS